MKALDVNLQVHYIPVHIQPFFTKNYGYKLGDYPISEEFYIKELSLPIYPSLKSKDAENISHLITNLIIEYK